MRKNVLDVALYQSEPKELLVGQVAILGGWQQFQNPLNLNGFFFKNSKFPTTFFSKQIIIMLAQFRSNS